jgi:hypothetical protein
MTPVKKRPGIRIFASLSQQCVASIVGLGPHRVIESDRGVRVEVARCRTKPLG